MKALQASALVLVSLVAVVKPAEAKHLQFSGPHPLPPKLGGGFCYIEAPHVHAFGPHDARLYRVHDDEYTFVGDPVPFGYDGARYAYYGPHPLVEVQIGEPVYCYLDGPHYHPYQPPASARFELRGGAFWFVGEFEPAYAQARPRYVVINDAYRRMDYARPVVDVTVAPPGFRATIVAGAPAAVVVPAPVQRAPGPPPPVQIGVGINFGGPPTVIERDRVIIREERHEHWKHDNGRHEGWFKNKGKHGRWR